MAYREGSMTMCGNGDCYYDQCECAIHDHPKVQECNGEEFHGLTKPCPFEGKERKFPYGWNGYENAYEGIEYLCDDCYDAVPTLSDLI